MKCEKEGHVTELQVIPLVAAKDLLNLDAGDKIRKAGLCLNWEDSKCQVERELYFVHLVRAASYYSSSYIINH